MNEKRIVTAALVVTVIHFLLTSLIGRYTAVQIGTQIGQVVMDGFAAAGDKNNGEGAKGSR